VLKGATTKTAVVLIGATMLAPALHGFESAETARPGLRTEMLVSTAWLAEHGKDRDLVILYVGRDRSQFDAGHIPGSRFVQLDELVEQRKDSLNELPPVAHLQAVFESLGVGDSSRVVLSGEGGGLLAARAYFTLDYLGHGNRTSLLDGGFEEWNAEGRPSSRDEPPHPARAHFTPQTQPEIFVSSAAMQGLSRNVTSALTAEYVLLDARPASEFDGIVNSEAVPKAGHIAGAHSLYWKKLITSETMPVLVDPTELKSQFARAGAAPGKIVVTYCRTGMQSSFTYFVAKYLGYRAAMYDGSVYEWVHGAGNDLVVSPRTSTVGVARR
jgi:thiosulfate/3-mercaptopyruvate sulfurtransferase